LARTSDSECSSFLVCRVDSASYALPIACVVEVTRVALMQQVLDMPAFVLGAAMLRGELLPVVNAAWFVSAERSQPRRLITLRVGERKVALAVDDVVGCFDLDRRSMQDVPPLLASCRQAVAQLTTLDHQLLMILETARLVPEHVLSRFASGSPG
jgi:purine-binding chemotaxis protein CheW